MDRLRAARTWRSLLCALAVTVFAPSVVVGQTAVLRTADGHPDLQGVWNFSTATNDSMASSLSGARVLEASEASSGGSN